MMWVWLCDYGRGMADQSQGDGWWQAPNDLWYSPEVHPDYVKPEPRPSPPIQEPEPQSDPELEKKPRYIGAWVIMAALAIVVGIAVFGGGGGDAPGVSVTAEMCLDQTQINLVFDEERANECRRRGFDPVFAVYGQDGVGSPVYREFYRIGEVPPTPGPTTRPTPRPPATPNPDRGIIYRWSGSARSVDLTMTNAQGNTEQKSGLRNYQETRLGTLPAGSFLYISVQNATDSGWVKCEILQDGRVISSAKSDGAYVIATCDASS